MRIAILLSVVFISVSVSAQKKVFLESKALIIETATKELDSAMQSPEGSLYLFQLEKGLKGEYVFDITIREKGEVSSVFVVGNNGGTISQQNMLKDKIKNFKFNFKMPKGKLYKFRYIFKFN